MTDDALIEAMARAMCLHRIWPACKCKESGNVCKAPYENLQYTTLPEQAQAALAVARPIIERETRERCAMIAEGRYWSSALGTEGIPKAIAAAIRMDGDE